MDNLGNTEPNRPVAKKSARFRPGRSLLAVVLGVVTDLGGTNVVGACYSLVIVIPMLQSFSAQGLPQAEMQTELTQRLQQATSNSILLIVLGLLLSVLGGYVAGRIAGYAEVVHGLASGISVTLISLIFTFILHLTSSAGPTWWLILGFMLTWAVPMVGGYFAYLQRARAGRKMMVSTQPVSSKGI